MGFRIRTNRAQDAQEQVQDSHAQGSGFALMGLRIRRNRVQDAVEQVQDSHE